MQQPEILITITDSDVRFRFENIPIRREALSAMEAFEVNVLPGIHAGVIVPTGALRYYEGVSIRVIEGRTKLPYPDALYMREDFKAQEEGTDFKPFAVKSDAAEPAPCEFCGIVHGEQAPLTTEQVIEHMDCDLDSAWEAIDHLYDTAELQSKFNVSQERLNELVYARLKLVDERLKKLENASAPKPTMTLDESKISVVRP